MTKDLMYFSILYEFLPARSIEKPVLFMDWAQPSSVEEEEEI
jgi:hypothetical protein